jgi:hypothetical protein
MSISLSAILFIFLSVSNVFASLQITEIMYSFQGSDTLNSKSREWIEIYNPDSTAVDITKIKLHEADTNHSISISSGASLISPLSYAVIADTPANFIIDNQNYFGILFDSIFSLSNTGESLELRGSDGTIFDSATYINTSIATTTNNQNPSNDSNTSTPQTISGQNTPQTKVITRTVYISAHSGTDDLDSYDEKTAFQATAGRERMALIGSILEFDAKYTLLQNNTCVAVFKWSFGDGLEATGKKVEHIYKFPGEYQVVLNGNCGDYNSVSRTKVKMISPNISISGTINGDIEIINNSKTEINIGNWIIKGGQKDFVLAQDTMIGANNKITLSKDDLNISSTVERISLLNPSGREVAHFSIIGYEDQNSISSKSEINTDTIIVSSSTMSITEAERLIKEYRKTLAVNNQEVNQTENTGLIEVVKDNNDASGSENGTNQTASVLETVNSTSTNGFWSKLIDFPIKSIKSFAHIFYNF